MTCQDGANAFYDSLKIRTGRVNRDKIELSSPLDRQPSFLSSRCCVFLFSTFRGTRPNNRQVVPLFFLSFHSVPICTLLASFHSFPSVLLSRSSWAYLARHENTNIGRTANINACFCTCRRLFFLVFLAAGIFERDRYYFYPSTPYGVLPTRRPPTK